MSDNEDENFCYFGKPLDPYDEDAFPKRRPITVEEQIATDAQGRRRFHGAFTGGFSAGFFNTVGSLEGWSPSEFKSTRQEKAQGMTQKPEDFMDEEDLGEYGIAPQVVRATKDYSTSKKRRKQVFSEGPIPGQPVLETLLTSGNETVGYLLLKNIGLKEKIEKHLDEVNSTTRMYGCQMPVECRISQKIENKQYQIPEIYRECLDKPKSNTFGLGYRGLDRSHVNLFKSSNLVVTDKNNKKFSIGGQAFGVGAFEEDDDDIYMREDMSNYDFELKKEKSSSSTKQQHGELLFGIFKPSKNKLIFKKVYPPPTIPHSFVGKHKVKKSRFEPIAEAIEDVNRASINPNIRAKYLGEETPEVYTQSQPMKDKESPKTVKKSVEENKSTNSFDVLSLMSDRFVSASLKEDVTNILEPVEKSETTHGTKDMRDAVKMKMFGRLTRVTEDWHPCSCLCKRFNVPEPFMDKPEAKNRKRTKNLIFENQKYIDDVDSFKPGVTTSASETKEDEGEENISLPSQQTSSNESQTNADSVLKTEIKIELAEHPESVEKVVEVENESSPKDITDRIGIEEKTDLFKAVFLSSSESESEDEEEEKEKLEKEKIEEFKETLLSEQLIPKIKPLKEGILSNLNFHPFSLPKPASEEPPKTATTSLESKIDDSSYGPQLPSEKVLGKSELFKLSSDSDDDWVEKDSNEKKKKSKHKKKNKKKDKHKHKKDKKSKK